MKKTKLSAITLVEVLITISVIGITIGMGATFIKYHEPSIRLHAATRQLRNNLLEARSLSLSLQINHGIHFRADENAYDLVMANGESAVIATTVLPLGISFASVGLFTNDLVRFNAAGGASQGGAITLQNTHGNTKQVIINPSGYVAAQQ